MNILFVILELFTSQGCSSCPPADALLSDLGARPGVIALAYHVDYWDDLGWKDPYSSPQWSARQAELSGALGAGLYTPQLVVNGRAQVVGSSRAKAEAAIAAAAAQAQIPVTVSARRSGDDLRVSYAAALREGDRVRVALTESGLVTRVERGENRGRTLRNDFVVRSLVEGSGGEAVLRLPGDGPYRVVVMVQGPDRAIRGAAMTEVPRPR